MLVRHGVMTSKQEAAAAVLMPRTRAVHSFRLKLRWSVRLRRHVHIPANTTAGRHNKRCSRARCAYLSWTLRRPPPHGPPLAPMTNIFVRRQDRNHRKSSDSTLATTQTLYRRWGIKTAREYARIKIGPPARQRQPGLRQRARARPCRRTLLRPAARLRARSWEIAPPGSTPNPNMF